ncbi:MAG: DUF222 domain-containing protein [Acidimicrobiales bacterium]
MTLFEDLRFEDMTGDGPTVGASGSTGSGESAGSGDASGSSGSGAGSVDGEGLGSVLEADMAFTLVTGFLRTQPLVGALARILAYQASLSALEAELLAAHQADTGASDRETERLAGQDGKRSKREAKKKARRSKAVGANPELGSDLADGELSTEQLDAIAGASAKTGGDAANDKELISGIKDSDADESRKLAKQYVDDHGGPTGRESRHARRRRLRKLSRFTTEDGADAIMAQGDTASIEEMWNVLTGVADSLYRKDGGRDLPAHKHPRSRTQRLYDAMHQKLTGTGSNTTGSRRPTVVVTATVADLFGDNPTNQTAGLADLVGTGPLPAGVFNRYLCNADIIGIIFDGNGQPLWQGRKTKTATPAQYVALIARDGGCVRCNAHHRECEAHHLTPWAAPAKGQTNIDTLALLCTDCHHYIHEQHLTLYQQTDRRWRTRAATPAETPPPRPPRKPGGNRNHPRRE